MTDFRKVGVKNVRPTAQTLTTSYAVVASSGTTDADTALNGQGINQTVALLTYTADAGATTPALQVKWQFASRGADDLAPPTAATAWFDDTAESSFSSGTSTVVPHVYNIAGNVSAALQYAIPVPVSAFWVRLVAKETLGAGSHGTLTASIINQYN